MSENLMENLNKEQLAAVTHKDGPVLIIAGAGTGKTTAITQRIAYIIEQGLAKPDEILALTFTEKAAGEMEERVDRLLPMGYFDLWISTFHGFGERILKEFGTEIGLPADFKLLNEFEQWALIRKNLDKFNLDYYKPLGNPTKFIQALVKHFSRLKDEDIAPPQYLEYAEGLKQNLDTMLSGAKKKKRIKNQESRIKELSLTNFSDAEGNFSEEIAQQEIVRINEVANAYHVYQQLLLDNNALDFGDLINYSLKLFRERPKILAKYRRQFKFILLDEFQDTNWAQYELIKMLTEPKNNLVVVGDDDQSIYKFRGASVSNILQFKKDFPRAEEIVLVKNYRSQQNLLDLSYQFIQLNNPNRLECKLNGGNGQKGGLNKKLVAQNNGQGLIEVIAGADVQDEIKKIIARIEKLKDEDADSNWNDFGILVRANDSAKEICLALDKQGLPYIFLASRGLYTKPIIMDIIAYFKMLDNYHESASLFRLLNAPIFNFKYQELVDFNYVAYKKSWSLFSTLKGINGKMGAETQGKIDKIINLINKHTSLVRTKTVGEIYLAFLSDSGYLQYLTKDDSKNNQEAIGFLNQFMKRIQKFEAASDDKSVKAFLAELDMEIDSGEQGAIAPDLEAGPEAIKVMTVHGAKGLEFKYVFIANLVDKRFPTIERKEQIEIPDALIKEILPEGDFHLEEERRLFYVAMTRAKEGLFFSWSPDYGGVRKKKPSRFLVECGLIEEQEENKKNKRNKKEDSSDGSLKIPASKKIAATGDVKYQLPPYISYTQIAAFSNCPYQYRFAHILRIPCRGKAQFSFGRTMHSTLQRVFELINEKKGLGQTNLFGETGGGIKKVQISLDEILEIYKEKWIDEWYESAEQKEKYKKLGKNILKEFYEKHVDNWPNSIFLERKFNTKISAGGKIYTIRGTIDRVDEIGGKIKIIDYKTGKPKEKLVFEDKEQLLIYQIAATELFAQAVQSLAFYYLENNSESEFLGTPAEIERIKEKIIETIIEINKGEFPPRPSALCKFCDFFSICEHRTN